MRTGLVALIVSILAVAAATAFPTDQAPLVHDAGAKNRTVSATLFAELEELARIVDISYCVGSTALGISKPFQCLSRCSEFENFELVQAWNTGQLLSDSCGYIALSHPPSDPRIVVAFRGTYSLANTVADLSTMPQEYIPYLPSNSSDGVSKCDNCTVHTGFFTSWLHTRKEILPTLAATVEKYPDYAVTLVGHSLGGAVAGLAGLDFMAHGWDPQVTTFGEPRLGNKAFMKYIDERYGLVTDKHTDPAGLKYRRVTHVNDPVPLLPLEEWGYHMHAGEIFISKSDLPPSVADVQFCDGDEDPNCIAGSASVDEGAITSAAAMTDELQEPDDDLRRWIEARGTGWSISPRYRLWQLFFAHRDYFWRLGLCVPGGDPWDWFRDKYAEWRSDL